MAIPAKLTRSKAASICAVLSLMGVLVPWAFSGTPRSADFGSYYVAGRLLMHSPPLLYSIGVQHSEAVALHLTKFLPWAHPAPEALIFAPLSELSLETAFHVWAIVNLLLLCLVVYGLRDYLAKLTVVEGYSVFACVLIPLGSGIAQGQDHILTLLLYCAAFLLLQSGKETQAGLMLGLALIRFQLTLPVLLCFLALRRWRVIAGAVFATVGLIIASFAIVGPGLFRTYLSALRYLGGHHDLFSAAEMPSIRGLVTMLIPHSGHVATVTALVSIAILLSAGWLWADKRSGPIQVVFASSILIGLSVDYHAFLYELSVVALAGIILAPYARFSAALWFIGALEVVLLASGAHLALLAPVLLGTGVSAIIHASTVDRRDARKLQPSSG